MSKEEKKEEDNTPPTYEELLAKYNELSTEVKKINDDNKKPKFVVLPKKNEKPPEEVKLPSQKENEIPQEHVSKFNGLQVFYPQFAHPDNVRKFDESCEVMTMRVNADPRFPEWLVS